jgi:putative copper resistance protein D
MWAYTLCVWVHVIAATAWVGSMIFFAVVVVPVLRRPDLRATAPALIRSMGARFRALGWVSLGVLVVTGVLQLGFRGIGLADFAKPEFRASAFGRALDYKLALVALVLLVSLAHDALSGKRALEIMEREPGSARALRTRRAASWIGRATMLLSLAVLYFAVALVRGMP